MKLYRIYPAAFERMYFMATDIEHAKSMKEVLWEKYLSHQEESWLFDREEQQDEIRSLRIGFDEEFDNINEASSDYFVDAHF